MLERPLTCPILIGRDQALEAVDSAAASARQGRGQVLLLAGEAGIGKSRLAREARNRAVAAGMAVLQGNCFESDGALPYAPLLDLLRAFCWGIPHRTPEEIGEAFGPWGPHLAGLLPELPALLPGVTPSPAPDPAQQRRDLFYALSRFITRLAAAQPLLLIVEDLHFADDSSLDVLLYLARHTAAEPVLWLMMYRLDENGPGLGHFLARLDRERLALRLTLEPLTSDEVAAMLQATLGFTRPVPPGSLQTLYELTDGNPFFVEEVLSAAGVPGGLAPAGQASAGAGFDVARAAPLPGIQDAVQRRAERLSEEARQMVTLAAIAGRRFDFALLQELTHLDEARLLALMKEAIAQGVVVEESPEIFAFRHELTRRAMLADLLARERRALHARVAEALAHLHAARLSGAPLADLAYHAYHAEDWPKTLDYARRAGEQALALYAPRAAAEQFTRALEAVEHLRMPPDSQLLAARGHAYETLGEFERARQDYAAAWQAAQADGDSRAAWEALLALGFLWAGRSYVTAGDYFRQALAMAQEIGEPALQAHSLNRLGNWYMNQEEPAKAARYHREAQRIFAEIGDRTGLAETLELLGLADHFSADQIGAAAYFQEAATLYRQLGDRRGLVSVLADLVANGPTYVADTSAGAGQKLDQATQGAEEALKLTGEMGWQAGEAMVLFLFAYRLGWHGYYRRALAGAQRALAIAEDIEHRQWMAAGHGALGALHLDMLALPEARRHLEQALTVAQEAGSSLFLAETAGSLALVCVLQREYARAEAVLETVLNARAPGAPTALLTNGQRHGLAARVELALARRDAGQALEITDRLIASAPHADGLIIPRLAMFRGRALFALGRLTESEADLTAAAEAARAQLGRPLLSRSELALGRLYRKTGQVQLASEHFGAARATAGELTAEIPSAELRAGFVRQLDGLIPHPHPPSAGRAISPALSGLTAHEREVAALVAEGRSNHEIAETLVLSERTVEGHVSSILSRLGYDSRVQIAAWVAEKNFRRQDTRP